MGAGASFSSDESGANSNFASEVPEWQSEPLAGLYDRAGTWYDEQYKDQSIPLVNESIGNAQGRNADANSSWQQQLRGGATGDMGLQQMFSNSVNNPYQPGQQSLNGLGQFAGVLGGGNNFQPGKAYRRGVNGMWEPHNQPQNPYMNTMKDRIADDAGRQSKQMLSDLDARAAVSGMSGGSRHGVATSRGYEDINKNAQRNMAESDYNMYDQSLNRDYNSFNDSMNREYDMYGRYMDNYTSGSNAATQALGTAAAGMYDANARTNIAGMQSDVARQGMMSDMLRGQDLNSNQALNMGSQMEGFGDGGLRSLNSGASGLETLSGILGRPIKESTGNSTSSSDSWGHSAGGGAK